MTNVRRRFFAREVFAEKSAAVKRINMENGKCDERRDGHAGARDCNLGIVCKNGEFAGIRIEPRSLANATEWRVWAAIELLCCVYVLTHRRLRD